VLAVVLVSHWACYWNKVHWSPSSVCTILFTHPELLLICHTSTHQPRSRDGMDPKNWKGHCTEPKLSSSQLVYHVNQEWPVTISSIQTLALSVTLPTQLRRAAQRHWSASSLTQWTRPCQLHPKYWRRPVSTIQTASSVCPPWMLSVLRLSSPKSLKSAHWRLRSQSLADILALPSFHCCRITVIWITSQKESNN